MVRLLLPALLAALPLAGQYSLYTCTVASKGYVVGAQLPANGLFVKSPGGPWRHTGFNHPILNALDYDAADPSTVYLAAGNGLIRARDRGEHWKILTGSDVTELLDVAVDRNSPGTVYFSFVAGIRVSHDGGATWRDCSAGLRRKYTQAIRVDSRGGGGLVAGNEDGIFRSENGGQTWRLAGAAGYQVLRVEQSPRDACYWLASTEQGGLFASTDCGASFESSGNLGVGRNVYDIAFDPAAPNRVAVAGWGVGVAVSEDRGKTWQARNAGLPGTSAWSVAFDPAAPGTLYASLHEEGLYVSRDSGHTWRREGLEGNTVFRMRFVPEAAR